jgi:hypothetical protein
MKAAKLQQMRSWLDKLGWPGLVGLLMLGIAVWTSWQVMPAMQAELDESEAQALHLRGQLQSGAQALASSKAPVGRAPAIDELTPALLRDTWGRTWASLPPKADAVARQGAVLAQASTLGVTVPTVQYRGGALTSLPSVWRQQMVLPVEASYPALRAWLGTVLQDKSISLDALDVVRADPMSDQIKARVALSVWWREEVR